MNDLVMLNRFNLKGTNTMNLNTVVSREELLEILKENKKRHIEIYNESFTGYMEKFKKDLEQKLEDLNSGKTKDLGVLFSPPVSHEREYVRAIRMMELHKSSTIELDMDNFNNLVMDEWNWTRNWITGCSDYSVMASGCAVTKGYI